MNKRSEIDKKKIGDCIIAEEKKAVETEPLIDFKATELHADNYEEKAKIIKSYYRNQLITKIFQLLFGIFCIVMTVHIGPFGSVFFAVALFYLIPDGLTKIFTFANCFIHYKDYVTAEDYHVDNGYLRIVMNAIGKSLSPRNSDDSI